MTCSEMGNGGDRNRCGLHPGGNQFVHRSKCLRAEFPGYRLGASEIGVNHANEFHRGIGLKVAIHTCVIAAESTGSDDSDAQGVTTRGHGSIVAHRDGKSYAGL